MYEWIHDDITWCGNECSNTECFRNMANRLSKTGMFSAAMFKGTATCPLTKNTHSDNTEIGKGENKNE